VDTALWGENPHTRLFGDTVCGSRKANTLNTSFAEEDKTPPSRWWLETSSLNVTGAFLRGLQKSRSPALRNEKGFTMNYNEWECDHCGHKGLVRMEQMQTNSYGVSAKEVFLMCPVCKHCEMDTESINQTSKNFREATRKHLGRVSFEDTLKLPKRYGVSRELLNTILELDEMLKKESDLPRIIRSVWDDRIPDEGENERIRRALESPKYFLERLEAAKDKIPAERYEKIHARVSRMK